MIRRKGPILAVAVIAAFALGWYRGLFGIDPLSSTTTQSVPPAPNQTTAPNEAGPAPRENPAGSGQVGSMAPSGQEAMPARAPAAPATRTAETASKQPAPSTAPGFDVVRVEPDGSTVVAGKGAANQAITLTDGTKTFGETRTDANGGFVMTLSLPTGSHRLQLAQRDDTVSDDAAVVNVPPPGKPDQLLVMMQRPGEASEILQRPDEAPAASASADADLAAEVHADAPSTPSEPKTEVAAVSPEAPRADVAPKARVADADLSVEAVEIEGDRLFVAGSARNGSAVRVYLDDRSVAETKSGAGDRFIASANVDVAVGDHTIRADALDGQGRVIGRVEVPFQRPEGATMAAVAAAPKAEQTVAGPSAPAPSGSAAPSDSRAVAPSSSVDTSSAPSPAPVPSTNATGESEVTTAAAAPASSVMPGEPQALRQAPLQASPSRVIIRRGDTLWRISRETYGRGSRYTVIYLANGDQIRDPNRIYPGQVFRMPDGEEEGGPPRG